VDNELYNRRLEEKILGVIIGQTMTISSITDSILSDFPKERRKTLKRRVWYTVKKLATFKNIQITEGTTATKTKIFYITCLE
jgi:hypothetical protein